MTTPDERRRNLIWGHEALTELAQDGALSPDWRIEAEMLLGGYPPRARLQQADAGDLERLQEEFDDVLCESKWFFMRMRGHPTSTERRRYSLLVIFRHFV